MASMPAISLRDSTAPSSPPPEEARLPKDEAARRAHRERFRASMAWALDEYTSTLEKLAK